MNSRDGQLQVATAAWEVVRAINNFVDLAKADPKFALAEAHDLDVAVANLKQTLLWADEKQFADECYAELDG